MVGYINLLYTFSGESFTTIYVAQNAEKFDESEEQPAIHQIFYCSFYATHNQICLSRFAYAPFVKTFSHQTFVLYDISNKRPTNSFEYYSYRRILYKQKYRRILYLAVCSEDTFNRILNWEIPVLYRETHA